MDLSINNTDLNFEMLQFSSLLETYIWNRMKSKNAQVAYGGYLEPRGIYQRSIHFNQQDPDNERNIHLGMDLWIEAETPIFTPLDAEVHSFRNNLNYGDYGPTIILKHEVEGIKFYTLYGHLSLTSISSLEVGQCFKKGALIATLGDATVNGDYPPHLHFQIIKDIGEFKGDYPGVSSKNDLTFFAQNCPDPNLLLNIY
ncbi:peptidoglycan DD-metalloendopeptidase family protein [Paucihalobacter sp.]|uniref:peptidoglycan DD-metalloendopeptidase family protein n=1 Tax=Paucihalobacter sp. TaxID=2850405 RepID=UPI003D1621BE